MDDGRLIRAEGLKQAIRDDPHIDGRNFAIMKRHIEEADTVDAVEVVRIEEKRQMLMRSFGIQIAVHQAVSKSSDDFYGIAAQTIELVMELSNAAFEDLLGNHSVKWGEGTMIIENCSNAMCTEPIYAGRCKKECIERYEKEMGIRKASLADVVQCKDCRHYRSPNDGSLRYCGYTMMGRVTKEDDFCSYGERKDK